MTDHFFDAKNNKKGNFIRLTGCCFDKFPFFQLNNIFNRWRGFLNYKILEMSKIRYINKQKIQLQCFWS